MTLKRKFVIIFSLVGLLNATMAIVQSRAVSGQQDDAALINLAGAQRMLTQRLAKEALSLQYGEPAVGLNGSIARFERVLSGLEKGDAELRLPATSDPEILAGLAEVKVKWIAYRESLEALSRQKGGKTLSAGFRSNVDVLQAMDAVVKKLESKSSASVKSMLHLQYAATALNIALLLLTFFAVLRWILDPLNVTAGHMTRMADGELGGDVSPQALGRPDEIGDLSRALQKMTVGLRSMVGDISSGIEVLTSASKQLSTGSNQLQGGAMEVTDKSTTVAAAAEEVSVNVTSVAASIEETASNLSSVTAHTGQMTQTIDEIAANAEKARSVTVEATRETSRVVEQIRALARAATEIGKVTTTITEISSQTNLLALNAAIEAARAGAAGKGFAVVANEIKELAQQTAAATEDIRGKITEVQRSVAEGAQEIEGVSQVIENVSQIVSSIAAAIEEQSATTKDIYSNISEASIGVTEANRRVMEMSQASQEIASDIVAVDRAINTMAGSSASVRTTSEELAAIAEQLKIGVSRFRV